MIRLFNTHSIRTSSELSGLWDFTTMAKVARPPKKYTRQMPVPACWEQTPGLEAYRGTAAYKRTITIDEPANIRLEFKGISHTADIYFDGKKVAYHYNAYTPFSCVIPDVRPGEHRVEAVVDNSFGPHSALHRGNDYYSYGGITRTVVCEQVADVFMERTACVTRRKGNAWAAELSVVLHNVTKKPVLCQAVITLAGQMIELPARKVKPGTVVLETEVVFESVKPWTAEQPHLYTMTTQLFMDKADESCDDLIERVGFRDVALKGAKLLVNGVPTFLKGFNRHEDHAQFGCAIPFSAMVKDLELIRDMGGNAVRTCHYPNDELFLDLCDEMGFYVWEENHARALQLEEMENPVFDGQCADCNREMVENHVNHPSIVMWGILNECASHTAVGKRKYAKQFSQIRKMDPSRPVTFATCHPFNDKCLGLEDIFSLNQYSRWYGDTRTRDAYMKVKKWADTAGAKGKPVIISEFGGGAIYGFREETRAKWSEERQCDILQECITDYAARPEITGLFIWQFADCRITDDERALARPRTKNNKGIVDEFRRPKLAYAAVKEQYGKIKR